VLSFRLEEDHAVSRAKRKADAPERTIKAVFEEFLEEQRTRISARTLRDYEGAIRMLETFLENYWPGHDGEAGSGKRKYCETFGPEEIPAAYSEFLGYFLPRKVICGKDTLRTAGTVTKKLAKWLVAKGYVDDEEGDDAIDRAAEASRDLPASAEALDILTACSEDAPMGRFAERMEDHYTITRVEPGRTWLEPLLGGRKALGPIPVPEEASALLKEGWDLGGVVGKTGSGWQLSEVWNLSP
jgi:hypothetical protein